jgi:hypothetical protein
MRQSRALGTGRALQTVLIDVDLVRSLRWMRPCGRLDSPARAAFAGGAIFCSSPGARVTP